MTTAVLKLNMSLPIANWKAIFFAGLFAMSLLLVFYALQVNNLTNGSYLLNTYENKIEKLSQENRTLQVLFAENDFMGQTIEKAQKLNLEKTTSVKYIQILDNSFAVAK